MTTDSIKKVCVFCGSSQGTKKIFTDMAKELGTKIATENWGLVYGGGSTGLMGALAESCVTSGGYVHGIIPRALIMKERSSEIPDSTKYGKTTLVDDMHTRKQKMSQESDAFIALPGGYGTLEELMEVTTWFQLNIQKKPIIVLNIDGFYDHLVAFIKEAIKNGFISEDNGKILLVANTPEEAFKMLNDFTVPGGIPDLKWT